MEKLLTQVEDKQQDQQEHFHVLAVDDSLIDRKLLEKLLKVSSYQVTCVDSVDKALEYLGLLGKNSSSSSSSSTDHESIQQEGTRVNLIMTDYCMPGMNGYDLLKRVKGSTWKDIPVIVMSSENIPSRITMCMEGGAEEFLLKPVQLSDVKKLQPYLFKSSSSSVENHTPVCGKSLKNFMIKHNEVTNGGESKCSSTKRKAATTTTCERRPKLQGRLPAFL